MRYLRKLSQTILNCLGLAEVQPRPPTSVRILVRAQVGCVVVFLAAILASGTDVGQRCIEALPRWLANGLTIGIIAASSAIAIAIVVSLQSFRHRLRISGLRLCTHCHYTLAGLARSGTCPECGKPYNIDDVSAQWHEWLGRRHL